MSRPWTWIDDHLKISHAEGFRILAVSRKAEDNEQCRRALIADIVNGVAIVQRWDWNDGRMADYSVRVNRRG